MLNTSWPSMMLNWPAVVWSSSRAVWFEEAAEEAPPWRYLWKLGSATARIQYQPDSRTVGFGLEGTVVAEGVPVEDSRVVELTEVGTVDSEVLRVVATGAELEEDVVVERMEIGALEDLRVVVTGAALEEKVEVVSGTALAIALPKDEPSAGWYVRGRSWDALGVVIVDLAASVAGDATSRTGPAYAAALGPGAAFALGGSSRG